MAPLPNIESVLKAAPIVRCPGCNIEMTLRVLVEPKHPLTLYSGTYRCPKCGTDTERQFKSDP